MVILEALRLRSGRLTPDHHPLEDHHPLAGGTGPWRVTSRTYTEVCERESRIVICKIWSPTGTRELFGLQGSVVGLRVKSVVISHVRCELGVQSDKGVMRKLILHPGFEESQVYSESATFSFSRR